MKLKLLENENMGRVTAEATIENIEDLWEVDRGLRESAAARSVVVDDALVDTGAVMLSLPAKLIRQLGLVKKNTKTVRTSAGLVVADVYGPTRLTIQARSCTLDVLEVPDGVPTLVGQVPLEMLDFIVDPINQRLIGNPEHNGEHMYDMF